MALSKIMISVLIVLVILIGLGSLAYPSVNTPFYNTQSIINTSTYRQTTSIIFGVSSYGVSYYYQTTSNPVIIPDLSSCSGPIIGPLPPCYFVIWTTGTRTISSQFTILSTSTTYATNTNQQVYTTWLIQTQYQNIPLYAALGLSESQFTVIVALIIVLSCLAMVYAYNRSKKKV